MREQLLQELERMSTPNGSEHATARMLYEYHYRGGFANIASLSCRQCVASIIVAGCFLCVACVIDWHGVAACTIDECSVVGLHIPGAVGWLFLVAFTLGAVVYTAAVRDEYRLLKETRTLYTMTVGIPDDTLHVLEWASVVQTFLTLEPPMRPVPCGDIAQLTQLIMRDTNYITMFANSDASPSMLSLPSQGLLWYFIWNPIFHNGRLDRSKLADPRFLHRQRRRAAIAGVVLSPFICAWMTSYFVVGNMRIRSVRDIEITRRVFSRVARLRFRHFNELPHIFEERMRRATELANKYLDAFPDPYIAVLETLLLYSAGAVITIIVIMSTVNENTATAVHVGDYNLLWWLAMLTACLSVVRRAPADLKTVSIKESQELLHLLSKYTLRTFDADELHKLRAVLRPAWVHMISELFESLLCPLRIWQIDVDAMGRLVRDHTVSDTQVGDVCSFARYQASHGDGDELSIKMQQSWNAFAHDHPSWSLEELLAVEDRISIEDVASNNDEGISADGIAAAVARIDTRA
tara:strand:- start:29 stop:1594 length:1566 start_codon:yes stop_codon:yes gene_type:complete